MARQSKLFGKYYVYPSPTALRQAFSTCNQSLRGFYRIRKHALKLAFWPDDGDLDWDWIQGQQSERLGELRIDETISGNNNLRVIFFKANIALAGDPKIPGKDSTMTRIWTLSAFQKKSQGFSASQIKAWKAMKKIIVKRHYGGNAQA